MPRGPLRDRGGGPRWVNVNFPEAERDLYDVVKGMAKADRRDVSPFMRWLAAEEAKRRGLWPPKAEASDG